MIDISIPGYHPLQLEHLVMDYNGTLACDGRLLDGVKETLITLSKSIELHVLTADTFGNVKQEMEGLPLKLSVIPEQNQDQEKLNYIQELGAEKTVGIGNGRNDQLMLKNAGLGIVLIQEEGASIETLISSDIVCKDILSALNLLIKTKRLKATLRS